MPLPPLVAAGLIGAGSSLISNVFGKQSQDSANNANYRIAQMNNEWSEKMMQKQMDYNTAQWQREADFTTDMFNKTNEYNSAKNQAQRLRDAGLNPAFLMGGANAGSASAASAPGTNGLGLPSPSSATMQPYRYDFSGIGNAVMSAYQLEGQRKQQDAQSRFLETQSDWYAAKAAADIGKIIAETDSHTAKTYWQNVQNQYAQGFAYEGFMKEMRMRQSMEVSIMNSIKQGVLMDKQIARYDERTNAEIADLVASTALKYSQGELNKSELKNVIETNKSLKLSNKEKEAIFDYVVKKAELDTWKFSATELPALGGYAIGQGLKKFGSWLGFGK